MPFARLLASVSGAGDVFELEELVPDKAFCEAYRVDPRTVRKWREQGTAPEYLRIGRGIFYRRSAIEAWRTARTFRDRDAEVVTRKVA